MTEQEVIDWRVLNYLAGQQPLQCREIKDGLETFDQWTIRLSLKRLMKAGDVREIRGKSGPIYYERAHGGYGPKGAA